MMLVSPLMGQSLPPPLALSEQDNEPASVHRWFNRPNRHNRQALKKQRVRTGLGKWIKARKLSLLGQRQLSGSCPDCTHSKRQSVQIVKDGKIQPSDAGSLPLLIESLPPNFQWVDELLFSQPQLLDRFKGASLFEIPQTPPLYLQYVSPTVGWGAFASHDIRAGEWIGYYCGVITQLVEGNRYSMGYEGPLSAYCVDASLYGNETRFINHGQPNARFRHAANPDGLIGLAFQATSDIRKHEQVLTDYGPAYWGTRTPESLYPRSVCPDV